MELVRKSGAWHLYQAEITPGTESGLHGCTARVLCRYRDLQNPFVPGLITWASR
jgi:hypothetical protein